MTERGRCTACCARMDGRVLRPVHGLDAAVRQRLTAHAPACGGRAVCPLCVTSAVATVLAEEGRSSLHDRIQVRWPLDPGKAFGVLPVPDRFHAHPGFRGRGVVIAFLDSGFHPHPDLIGRRSRIRLHVDATTDAIRESPFVPTAGALSWHGLMTSSVASGDGMLSGGRYRGLASDAELVLVKISDPRGGVHDADIERGLAWLVRRHRALGVRVLNLSVGGDEERRLRESPVNLLVERLVAEGVVVVAAAGNAGQRRLVPPASAPSSVTVGGLDDQNLLDPAAYRIWHGNYGPTVDGVVKPEVVAPSIWVAAPILPGTDQEQEAASLEAIATSPDGRVHDVFALLHAPAGLRRAWIRRSPEQIRAAARRRQVRKEYVAAAYKRVEGTSFAAPIVSSVIAVMLEANPRLPPKRAKALVLETAERVPGVPRERQGFGVVDPARAVARALREPGGPLFREPVSPAVEGRDVRFLLHLRDAHPVAVIGGFNRWDPAAAPFRAIRTDVFEARARDVEAGEWRYAFLLEDGSWIPDPENPRREPDGSGGFVSKLPLGES